MRASYLFCAFYSSAAQYKSTLAEINTTIRQISKGDMHILMPGTGGLCIGFTSDLPSKQLYGRLSRFGDEQFYYVVVQVAAMIQGTMSEQSLQWIQARFGRPQKED
ncbi:MAG TPA: hypothetical protein VJO54_05935 [Burkholderiales bacterium]|nr:hypothetical protein [Burkholderiales bacterium]